MSKVRREMRTIGCIEACPLSAQRLDLISEIATVESDMGDMCSEDLITDEYPVLVKFFENWCSRCVAMKKAFENAAARMAGKVVTPPAPPLSPPPALGAVRNLLSLPGASSHC